MNDDLPAAPARRSVRGTLRLLARWALGVLPLLWLLRQVEPAAVLMRVRSVGVGWLLAATVLFCLSWGAASARWRMLMRAFGARQVPRVWTLFLQTVIAGYFNMLPSGLVGDVVRGYRTRAVVPDLAVSYSIVVIERLVGILTLFSIALLAPLLSPAIRLHTPPMLLLALGGGVVASAVGLALPAWITRFELLRAGLTRIPSVGRLALRLSPLPTRAAFVRALSWSVVAHVLSGTGVLLLYRPLLGSVSWSMVFVMPLAMALAAIPVTPAALGQRELALVWVMGWVGVSADASVAVGLLMFATLFVFAILGGVLYWAWRDEA